MKRSQNVVRKGYLVTKNFDDTQVVGHLELNKELEDLLLVQCVIAPAYIQHEDGTLELTEFSLIPAPDAAGLITRGMEKVKE
jgi:hypothetical protein